MYGIHLPPERLPVRSTRARLCGATLCSGRSLLCPFIFGLLQPKLSKNFPDRQRRLLSLAQQTISVPASRTPCYDVGVDHSSTNPFPFLSTQLASALAIQNSVLFLHAFSPRFFALV